MKSKIVAPIVIPIIRIKVQSHLSKINPAKSATGKPNPAITTQTIVDIKNTKEIKNKLLRFNSKK